MKILLFICLTLFSLTVQGQEKADEIIAKFIQAIGGQSEIAKVQNIYSFADCVGPKDKYTTEIHTATNLRTIFKQVTEKGEVYLGQTNGETYWTKDSDFKIANKKEAFVWRSHEFQWIAIRLLERFREPKLVGNEDFAGKSATKLAATDELGRPANLFFDKTTNLLLGFTVLDPFSEKPETIRLTFNEWKKIGKLLLPSKVTATDKQGDFVLNFHTIKVNQIKENVFDIPSKVAAIKELLELHNLQRNAHFNRDAKLLVSIQADNFIEISSGKINNPKKEDLIKRFQSYFDAVTFIEWDDIKPPIIQVSEDATLAYMLVSKRVRLKTKDNKEQTSIFAWTSTFQKIKGKWMMTVITSTVAPPSNEKN